MTLVKDKKFYMLLLSLALPIAFQDLIKFSLSLADNIMVGVLSETALSAVTLANKPFFVFSVLCFGLASGGAVLAAQYFGKQDKESISKITAITLSISLILSVIFTLCVLLMPEQIMRIFSSETDIIELGIKYIQIQGYTYLLYGITNSFIILMRSTRTITIGVIITGSSFFVNIFFNWMFIYGNLGAPAMGVEGAALGTLIARTYELIFLIIYLVFFNKNLNLKIRSFLHWDRTMFKDFLHYSIPVAINELGWSLGVAMQSVILGHIGGSAVAANSIVSTAQEMVSILIFGIAGGAFVLLGNKLGSGEDKEEVRRAGNSILLISVLIGVVISLILFTCKGFIINIYNVPADTKELAGIMMNILCITTLFQAYNYTGVIGLLRAGGDTRFTTLVDVLALWIFSVPLGYLLGFHMSAAIPLVFLALRGDEIVKLPFIIWRLKTGKWLKNITR